MVDVECEIGGNVGVFWTAEEPDKLREQRQYRCERFVHNDALSNKVMFGGRACYPGVSTRLAPETWAICK